MTKYDYLVHEGSRGSHIVVTRLFDGAQKYFFQTGKGPGVAKFLDSMTDELTDGYFPKPDKKGRLEVDNWAFLGFDIDRHVAHALATVQYGIFLYAKKIHTEMGWA